MGRFHTVLRAEMSRRLAPEGLSVPEFTALSVLSVRGGLSNAELARRSFVTPQAMNQVLASLEEKQLVARPAPGEQARGHHRARGAKLTAKGRRAVARAQTIVDAIEDQAFAATRTRMSDGRSPACSVRRRSGWRRGRWIDGSLRRLTRIALYKAP